MKEMFNDVLQQVMKSELENKLGYEKVKEYLIRAKKRCRKTTGMGTHRRR
jgi:hypothetical protein